MKNVNTFGVHFTIRQNKNSENKYTIYVRIVVNKTRAELALKHWVRKEDWNPFKGFAKPKNEELNELNSYLETLRGKISSYYRLLDLNDAIISAEILKNKYLGIDIEENKFTLLWLSREHNVIMNKVLKPGSLKNYFTTEKYLQNFLKTKYNAADIYLKELKYEFITAFEYHLRNHPIKKNDPCTNNGTMKHLERLKKMVSWATKNGWIEKDPFTYYQLKFKRTERDYLSANEMSLIENFVLTNDMLQKVRDLFIFSCYTGLSYIDLIELKPQQIITSIEGVKWIKSKREKTGIAVNVPLLEPASIIVDKFSKEYDAKFRDTVFPKISNQEVNRSLKVIAEIAGIKKYMTFHLARHTFATTVTLMNGVPIESISKMLGHSKITTTMIYARVTQSKIGMDMELLQNRLNDNKEKGKLSAVK